VLLLQGERGGGLCRRLVQRDVLIAAPPQLGQRAVDGDGRRPRREATLLLEAVELVVDAKQAILRQILEILEAELAAEAPHQRPTQVVTQIGQRVSIGQALLSFELLDPGTVAAQHGCQSRARSVSGQGGPHGRQVAVVQNKAFGRR
jgi:hypothetical protein